MRPVAHSLCIICLLAFLTPSPGLAASADCEFVIVSKVIDGDTIVTGRRVKVRLLGIDTPETGDSRRDVQWYGKEAARWLREKVEGREVCLRRDENRTIDADQYGRKLRYVWLDGVNLNAEAVKEGYAFAYPRQPFQYLDEFRRLENEARRDSRGLWDDAKRTAWLREREREREGGAAGARPITAAEARQFVGREKTVRFRVERTKAIENKIFLNSREDYRDPGNFTVVIPRKDALQFVKDPATHYLHRTIEATGEIILYKGRPEIVVNRPSQIRVVE